MRLRDRAGWLVFVVIHVVVFSAWLSGKSHAASRGHERSPVAFFDPVPNLKDVYVIDFQIKNYVGPPIRESHVILMREAQRLSVFRERGGWCICRFIWEDCARIKGVMRNVISETQRRIIGNDSQDRLAYDISSRGFTRVLESYEGRDRLSFGNLDIHNIARSLYPRSLVGFKRCLRQIRLLPQENVGSDVGDENQAGENSDNYISPIWTVVRNVLLYLSCAALIFASYWLLVVNGRWIAGSVALVVSTCIFWRALRVIFYP